MVRPVCLVLALALVSDATLAQTALQQQIRALATAARGNVAVACSLPGSTLNCDLDPHAHPPMLSVFKFPLALTTLHLIEQGRLSLDQAVRFLPGDRILPQTYSPLQDEFPAANVDVPLRRLLSLAVSLSDNTATDIVLRLIGGPAVVDDYVRSVGVTGFHLEDDEHALHRDVAAQYRNWFEPAGAVQLLRLVSDRSPITPEHTRLLLGWMRDTPIGAHQIKGQLPPGTVVMHKTGRSRSEHGVTYATNDIGLISLPDGRRLALAIFVTDSAADDDTRDLAMARIAKAVYDASFGTEKARP